MGKVSFIFVLFATLTMSKFQFSKSSSSRNTRCIESERKALIAFKEGCIDKSNRLASWVGEDCCSWEGTECSNQTGHVLKLDLRNRFVRNVREYNCSTGYCGGTLRMGSGDDPFPVNMFSWLLDYDDTYGKFPLGGKISSSILELKHLKYLDLSGNNFSSCQIPPFLGAFKELQYLNLSNSGFVGMIPSSIANLSFLQHLDLSSHVAYSSKEPFEFYVTAVSDPPEIYPNVLKADNLQWVSYLSSLAYLDLSSVSLENSSNWLQEIKRIPALKVLRLSDCQLPRLPPTHQVNFTDLVTLDLSGNFELKSNIPIWLFNLTNIRNIVLSSTNLQGSIPSEIGNFCNLEDLDLSYNQLSGKMSGYFGNMSTGIQSSLRRLHLENNSFSGPLLEELGHFHNLELLCLHQNVFSGPIPASLGKLSQLKKLRLSHNKLSGSVPASIGELSNLELLDVSHNRLEGFLSEHHFARVSRLSVLDTSVNSLLWNVSLGWIPPFQLQYVKLSSNRVGPRFPQWLCTQQNITHLIMANASISDSIPEWFENISLGIIKLLLSGNQIGGKLPKFHFSLGNKYIFLDSNNFEGSLTLFPSNIIALFLHNNSLSGHIPPEIGILMPNLTYLSLSNNNLNGSIPPSMCNMKYLENLDLSQNQLSGRLPDCWSYQTDINEFNVAQNFLSGRLPSSIGSLQLFSLHLNNNNFHGKLPKALKNLTALVTLDLSHNKFAGTIPSWIGENMLQLVVLNLQSNMIIGNIPSSLCQLSHLQVLNIGQNSITGIIPHCFSNFSAMAGRIPPLLPETSSWYQESTSSFMKGVERRYTTTLKYLHSIDLSSNRLVGSMPGGVFRLSQLQNLNLSKNHLVGKLPSKIKNLKSLESLDLSKNKLRGSLPTELSTLDFLGHLDVSHNDFSGRIPLGNHLQTFSKESYIGNEGLCGYPLSKSCEGNNLPRDHDAVDNIKDKDETESLYFYTGLGSGFLVGFLGVCGTLSFNNKWRYAYFRFLGNVYDHVWVAIAVNANLLRQRVWGIGTA